MRKKITWKRCVSIFMVIACISMYGCTKDTQTDNQVKEEQEEVRAKYSLLETAQRMQSSAFTDKNLTDLCYGMNDPSNVGVIEEEFDDVLYPIPSDKEFDGEIINWDTYSHKGSNIEKLKEILKKVARKNAKGIKVKLNMPKNAVIDLDSSNADSYLFAIVQKGLDGFYLQGNNCTFNVQYDALDYRGLFYFEDGGDIHIQNLTIDYEVATTVTGIIKSYDMENLSVTLEVFPEFNELIERLKDNQGTIYNYLEYSKANKIPKDDGTYVVNSNGTEGTFEGYSISGNSKEGYLLTVNFSEAASLSVKGNGVGDYGNVLFSAYNFNAVNFYDCGNIYLETVTIHTSPSMGIVGWRNKNMYMNGIRIALKEDSRRLITTCVDGIHILQNDGDVQITNTLIENCHDDALNLKSGYWYDFAGYDVLEGTVTIRQRTEGMEMPKPGQAIEFYDNDSFEKKTSLTIESVTGTTRAYIVKVKESLAGLGMDSWDACSVANDSSADLLFKNNIVQNKRNKAIIMMASEAEVANNTFQNIAHGAIYAWAVLDKYNESGICGDSIFKNNKFINGNYETGSQAGDLWIQAAATTYGPAGTIKNIHVENNFFSKSGASSVTLVGVENASVLHNLYYQASRKYEGTESVILLYNSDKIQLEGNYCYCPETANFKGIYPGGTTTIDAIAMKDNEGLAINDGLSGTTTADKQVTVPALGDHKITIDGDMSDWTVGVDVDIVGASTEDQRPATKDMYNDNFKIKMAKITYNKDGIYFGFDLYDNELMFKEIENFWYGDCVELFMTASTDMPNADMRLSRNLYDTLQLVCVPAWKDGFTLVDERTTDTIKAQQDKFEVKVVETEEGYCGEAFISFEFIPGIKEAIDNGQGVVMNCVFADGERVDMQRIQLANVPHIVENNKIVTGASIQYMFSENE